MIVPSFPSLPAKAETTMNPSDSASASSPQHKSHASLSGTKVHKDDQAREKWLRFLAYGEPLDHKTVKNLVRQERHSSGRETARSGHINKHGLKKADRPGLPPRHPGPSTASLLKGTPTMVSSTVAARTTR